MTYTGNSNTNAAAGDLTFTDNFIYQRFKTSNFKAEPEYVAIDVRVTGATTGTIFGFIVPEDNNGNRLITNPVGIVTISSIDLSTLTTVYSQRIIQFQSKHPLLPNHWYQIVLYCSNPTNVRVQYTNILAQPGEYIVGNELNSLIFAVAYAGTPETYVYFGQNYTDQINNIKSSLSQIDNTLAELKAQQQQVLPFYGADRTTVANVQKMWLNIGGKLPVDENTLILWRDTSFNFNNVSLYSSLVLNDMFSRQQSGYPYINHIGFTPSVASEPHWDTWGDRYSAAELSVTNNSTTGDGAPEFYFPVTIEANSKFMAIIPTLFYTSTGSEYNRTIAMRYDFGSVADSVGLRLNVGILGSPYRWVWVLAGETTAEIVNPSVRFYIYSGGTASQLWLATSSKYSSLGGFSLQDTVTLTAWRG